ncbi:hypothetical protein [Mesobacillus jeotgali]|uniref:hypothetical protein n=1 Tax=Mesobacillus jeotgali TaxID=129985 RepID=UPI0009A6FE39|nr:hypothetical protein [Mesobacillus jeotgali]
MNKSTGIKSCLTENKRELTGIITPQTGIKFSPTIENRETTTTKAEGPAKKRGQRLNKWNGTVISFWNV